MPEDNNQQQTASPNNSVNRDKVIQPVSDMSEYVNKNNNPPVEPVKPTQTLQTEPKYGLGKPIDASKIYPNITHGEVPRNDVLNDNQIATKVNNQRVVSRVPSLQVYAFLIIIYSAFTVLAFSTIFQTTKSIPSNGRITTAGTYSLASPLLLKVFGIAAINLAVGIYLLASKSVKTVNALLTALLIIGSIGLLNTLISTARVISHINAGTIVSILISAGLLMYLWNVKSQVDLLNTN